MLIGVILFGMWASRERSSAVALVPDQSAEILAAQLPLLTSQENYLIYLPVSANPDDRYIAPLDTSLPLGAVGFIDNGCTGVLIDESHVLAAGHCFFYDGCVAGDLPAGKTQGEWQIPTLYFFPNYHPSRANPTYHRIDRMVTGTRSSTCGELVASDWAIGHLETPVTAFPSLPIDPAPSGAYPLETRIIGYPRDSSLFSPNPEPNPPGSPDFCPVYTGACWWTPPVVDPDCLIYTDFENVLRTQASSCKIIAGNSGSPILRNVGSSGAPDYRITGVVHGPDYEPAVARFQYAPRYAKGVGVATLNDGSPRTQVFATDNDSGRMVSRYREGTTLADGFTTFAHVGWVPDPDRMAAFHLTNNKPAALVVSGNGELYSIEVDLSNNWTGWATLTKPPGVTGFLDVDAAYDVNGTNQIYAIGNDNRPYTRRRQNTSPYAGWQNWEALASAGEGPFTRITAIRRSDGTQQVFMLNATGTVFTRWQTSASPTAGWSPLESFHLGTIPVPGFTDIDAGLIENQVGIFLAVDNNGNLWARAMDTPLPSDGWNDWYAFPNKIYAPLASPNEPAIGEIEALTADIWQEQPGGAFIPVVFATDVYGNIYFTTRSGSSGWEKWRNFYQ